MKKTLLTASLLLASMTSVFAQMPDASQWKVGDEITDKVGWGNLSFENDPMDYWRLERLEEKGNLTLTGGCFEIYDGQDVDLYQYVQLPAGMYKVECQAYYRFGTSWADDPNAYGTEDWEDLAILYAANGTYDIDSDAFTAGRTFKTPVMPRLFDYQAERIFEDMDYTLNEDGSKNFAAGWDMSDGDYGDKGWGPCSVPGSLAWFQAGKYMPYDDGDGTKYNTVTFFLTEPGYARIGITKIDPKAADSFMATNFKMYYMGEADEAAELMAVQDEVKEVYYNVEKIKNQYDGGMIYTLISDALIDFDGEYGNIDDMDKEACAEAKAALTALYEEALAAQTSVASLTAIIPGMEVLYNSTNYAGKAAFGDILNAAKNCIDPNCELGPDDDFSTIAKLYSELLSGRIAYLMTQDKVDGAYNFSAAITTPFFTDAQYTPIWSDEANAYVFPTLEGVADELQPENTWATIQEQDYPSAKAEAGRENWIPISETVTISEKFAENRWVIKSTTWHGGGPVGITMQHSYPAIGGWTAEPSGNPELLYQTITDLPNGYYSMSGLMCNAGADISPLQYVYIEAGDAKEIANLTMKGNPWWGGDKYAWRTGVWQKLTTNMVYVSDGKVTIGSSSDAFYAATGFQLYYYGENPDFTALLGPALEAAKANIENLTWAGDKAAANAILASIPTEINSQEGYQAALKALADINTYIQTATDAINNWKSIENFGTLLEAQPEGSPESELVMTAYVYTLGLGEGENDTYLDAIASGNDYNAYVSYLDYRSGMGDLINNAEVAAVIASQNAHLIANYANAATLAEFKAALAAPYNKALLASLGMDGASEANPVDITSLIINPKFDEGAKGWDGEMTVDSLGTVERWNCDFNISQTIYSLPAGCYKIQAQALYRDAGDAETAYNNWFYTAAEDMEFWETGYAKMFANGRVETVVSIASETFADQSHTAYVSGWQIAEEGDENGNDVWEPVWVYQEDLADDAKNAYPFDTKVDDLGEISYYPASLRGVSRRFEKSPEAYINTVEVMVEEGGSLTFGFRNDGFINSHWLAFDNFKLFYLGANPSTGINSVTNVATGNTEYYSISGVRLNGAQKGINIVKMADGKVKKVLVK